MTVGQLPALRSCGRQRLKVLVLLDDQGLTSMDAGPSERRYPASTNNVCRASVAPMRVRALSVWRRGAIGTVTLLKTVFAVRRSQLSASLGRADDA